MQDIAFSLTVGTLTFLFTVVWGQPLIKRLRTLTLGQTTLHIPADDADSAEDRRFVPTMGGLLVVIPTVVVTVGITLVRQFSGEPPGYSILLPTLALLGFGIIGAIDDWETMRGIVAHRISPRLRIIGQVILAIGAACVLYFLFDIRSMALPGVIQRIDLGWRYLVIAPLLIFGMSNAVDLTDGVDGLAGIVSVTAFSAYGIIAISQGQFFVTQFCLTLVGALVALLWFNIYPAQLRLGDSGALALGGTLAVVALLTGQWLILPVVAFIPMLEALSVVIQLGVYGLSRAGGGEGVYLLEATPLHHHFEIVGWSQVQIYQRFWVIQLLASTVGVALALL